MINKVFTQVTFNSCFYSDLATQPAGNAVIDARRTIFQGIFYIRQYREDCKAIYPGDVDKVSLLLKFLNSLDKNF